MARLRITNDVEVGLDRHQRRQALQAGTHPDVDEGRGSPAGACAPRGGSRSDPIRRGSAAMPPSMRRTPRAASEVASDSRSTMRSEGSPMPRRTMSPLMTPLPSGGGPVSSVRKRNPAPSRMSAVVVSEHLLVGGGVHQRGAAVAEEGAPGGRVDHPHADAHAAQDRARRRCRSSCSCRAQDAVAGGIVGVGQMSMAAPSAAGLSLAGRASDGVGQLRVLLARRRAPGRALLAGWAARRGGQPPRRHHAARHDAPGAASAAAADSQAGGSGQGGYQQGGSHLDTHRNPRSASRCSGAQALRLAARGSTK